MRSSIICFIPPLMLAESYEVVEYIPIYNWTRKGTWLTSVPWLKRDEFSYCTLDYWSQIYSFFNSLLDILLFHSYMSQIQLSRKVFLFVKPSTSPNRNRISRYTDYLILSKSIIKLSKLYLHVLFRCTVQEAIEMEQQQKKKKDLWDQIRCAYLSHKFWV